MHSGPMNRGGQTTILLLEDHPEMRKVLSRSLKGRLPDAEILDAGSIDNLNYKIDVATTARAAKGKPFTVDFIIADQVEGNRGTEGAQPEYASFESGYDPAEPVDQAIMATRRAVFPDHGLLP